MACDAIHREVARLREAGKAVIVSMGNVAASGGYFIAAPATKIVAQPATLTGSIGVISGERWQSLGWEAGVRRGGAGVREGWPAP